MLKRTPRLYTCVRCDQQELIAFPFTWRWVKLLWHVAFLCPTCGQYTFFLFTRYL